jgi:N6-L-threonylcarbamoyladenine synthase
MKVLGIETSCDETGVALVEAAAEGVPVVLAEALHSQAAMHEAYGGVVPELASRDHVRRLVPLVREVLARGGAVPTELDAVAYTRGPGLAGALLVGAGTAAALAAALGVPAVPVHHLEGHLLSPFLAPGDPPRFPFVALLVSGGHTQLMRVEGVGRYALLGETVDDAAGEAFDKTAKLLGLGYPGGPALAALAASGRDDAVPLPRPKLHSGDLDFSFAGLKTAVATRWARIEAAGAGDAVARADLAASAQAAIVDVLVAKSIAALQATGGRRLVVAGGVGANQRLRERLAAAVAARGGVLHVPPPALCGDNGTMIALAAAMRWQAGLIRLGHPRPDASVHGGFDVEPRWPLDRAIAAGPVAA